MRAAYVILAVAILTSIAVAQDNGTQQPYCPTASCGQSSQTCADGFVATCQQSCDEASRSCQACTPSCAGHEQVQACSTTSDGVCPSGCAAGSDADCCTNAGKKWYSGYGCYDASAPAPATCSVTSDGICPGNCAAGSDYDCCTNSGKYWYDNGCFSTPKQTSTSTGSSSNTSTATTSCPAAPSAPACGKEQFLDTKYDSNRCITGYECKDSSRPQTSCPAAPSPPACNGFLENRFDNNGCVVGYECRTSTNVNQQCVPGTISARDGAGNCQNFPNSCLPPGWSRVDSCDRFQAPFCGDGRCDIGENPNTCSSDCSGSVQTRTTQTCPDGSQIQCKQDADGRTFCDQCPVQNLPQGCHQEKDDKGFVRVVCESKRTCPEISQEVRLKCVDQKGIPVFKKDPSGCEQFSCQFGNEVSNPFSGYNQCPQKEQIDAEMNKCGSLGLRGAIVFEGGCQIARCVEERREEQCPHVSSQEKEKINSECLAKGFQGIRNRFEGCREIIECASSDQGQYSCPRDVPPEAYQMCGEKGGELIVQRNQNGCVQFSRCVAPGDASNVYVERSSRILESSELLSLAFKLESLNVELDKLAKQTNDIAEYYKSTGSADEGRFRRVSDMFVSAKEESSGIKDKIRSKIDSLTEDDMLEIKRDLKYLKDVMIKDILYVMLSSNEDVEGFSATSEKSENDCGTDGGCFDEAFRLCKPITFEPDREVTVSIAGLDGDNCILKARMKEGKGPPAGVIQGVNPPYEMTCKIKNYALGMKGPEDIMPFCEGSMVKLMEQFGPNGENAPGVPGKCSGDECRDYCGRGQTEAKECLENLGQYLPPEAKQGLEMLASGKGGFGQQRFDQGFEGQSFQQQGYRPQQTIRPEQCEFTDMSDEECVDYIQKNLGPPSECKGLTDAQCRKFLLRKWENQKQQPVQSYGGPQQFQQRGQQFDQGGFQGQQQFKGQQDFNQPVQQYGQQQFGGQQDFGQQQFPQQQYGHGGFNQPVQQFIEQDYGRYEGGAQGQQQYGGQPQQYYGGAQPIQQTEPTSQQTVASGGGQG
ncbi:MAG: hypothetical protein HYT73_00310 [Candidatus Aenigmarchaeota archaeon]|nr:hypothetical protein [Candidatus Aenigmarchaeota archaeon]